MAALLFAANAALPVPWWILALAAVFFVFLCAKIISLLDERRKLKREIAALEGKEVRGPVPDTELGGHGD